MRRRELIAFFGSAAVAWPFSARAQPPMPIIGYLAYGYPETDNFRVPTFRQGLNETGYIEGRNVVIEYRWARGQYERLPNLAADLVHLHVSVIAAMAGAPPALAAKAATSTIPIVVALADPVQFGLVASLNRPGGNITGVATLTAELVGKRLDLLRELLPTAHVVAVMVNPANTAGTATETTNLDEAARSLGLQLHFVRASTEAEIDATFEALVELRADALIVSADPFFTSRKEQIVALAAAKGMPATYVWREFAEVGGLMSYGSDLADSYRQAGIYTGKILKGAKPADLPVQQVVKLALVINLKTAKALGLTIPPLILARADEVIE
jgi:putative ABC transport system substrate-binding protein